MAMWNIVQRNNTTTTNDTPTVISSINTANANGLVVWPPTTDTNFTIVITGDIKVHEVATGYGCFFESRAVLQWATGGVLTNLSFEVGSTICTHGDLANLSCDYNISGSTLQLRVIGLTGRNLRWTNNFLIGTTSFT